MKTVVHEIRNHLAVAVANVEAFLDGKLTPTPQRLQAVLQALNETEALLGELRDAAAPVQLSAELREINVCEHIRNELTALEAAAREKGVTLEIGRCLRADPACLAFLGDPVRIGEIVKNVVMNAIRFTPPERRVGVDCRRDGGRLVLTVQDDGPGIPADEKAHVFERGFRGSGSAEVPGEGIGLSLVQAFVRQHGGEVEVADAPSGGASFRIALPGTPLGGHACSECVGSSEAAGQH